MKRRIRETFKINDENVDPKATRSFGHDAASREQVLGDPMEVDENQDPLCSVLSSNKKNTKSCATRTKHAVASSNQRSVLSPTGVNGEARVSISPQSKEDFLPMCREIGKEY